MKKAVLSIILSVLIAGSTFSWGDKGHRLIAEKSFAFLPKEMKDFFKLKEEVILHCIDPDLRKDDDRTEGPKHYIDLDYYPHFLEGRTILTLDSMNAVYGDSLVLAMGYLPWATSQTYYKLVEALKKGDKQNIILYASDLAHYVGDGFQPMHACLNYDGQLTKQKGAHARYEIKMIDRHIDKLRAAEIKASAVQLTDIQERIFDYITGASIYADVIIDADRYATSAGFYYNEDQFYDLLWFRTKFLTIQQMNTSALELASLYYTAWISAGKPKLAKL